VPGHCLGVHPWIGLSDDVRLGVLTEWVTPDLVDKVLAGCGRVGRKPGALPPRFMVYFILALALFQQDSYDDVAENLVGRWAAWMSPSSTWRTPPGQ
jgi:Insertion element 4 transposase N-terminal